MMKKHLLLLPLLLMLLSGCGLTSEPAPAENSNPYSGPQYDWHASDSSTLTIWAQAPDGDRTYLQRAFARYEELTGGHITLLQMDKEEYASRTLAAFTQGGPAPDILLSYGGANIEQLDPAEHFYDFTDAVWVDDLTDTAINQTISQGRVIGLPHWEASISGTLYNKEIFQKYNIPVPQTQAEFLDACEALSQAGVIPLYLPAAEISMLLYQFPLDALIDDAQTLAALNSGAIGYPQLPGLEQVLAWYRTMAQRGYLGPDYLQNDWAGMNEALESGRYAMMLCWDTWLYTDFDGDPEQFGLMPAFMGTPDGGTFEGPNLGLLIVNQHSPHLAEALNLITFMADPYNYNEAFAGIYTAPVFKHQAASISTPQYIESERLIERRFYDSTAWLRIRGFSQMDAVCILQYMAQPEMTAQECLTQMEALRQNRLAP